MQFVIYQNETALRKPIEYITTNYAMSKMTKPVHGYNCRVEFRAFRKVQKQKESTAYIYILHSFINSFDRRRHHVYDYTIIKSGPDV